MRKDPRALLVVPIVVLIGLAVAWVGSQGGSTFRGVPVFALAVGLVFLIQWLAFIPAYLMQSERFFDLTGSLTYVFVTILAAWLSAPIGGRSIVLTACVVAWAVRLGAFLFRRVRRARKDDRFAPTPGTRVRSSARVCGPGLDTRTTSARSCSGSASPSSRCPLCWVGS